jgi:cytoskeletal protein CcmA (bactofilin family)
MFRKKPHASIDVGRLSSLIATGVEIVGDVVVTDGVRVDGQVSGSVLSKQDAKALLVLSEKGRIDGNVRVHDAVINGTICGDLEVEHFVELQPKARVTGDIKYRTLQLECGAQVEGRLECIAARSEPRADARPADERPATPSNVVSLPKAAES